MVKIGVLCLFYNELYISDLLIVLETGLPWDQLQNKTILITGSTGCIGSVLVDVLMYFNKLRDGNIKIIAIGRNKENARNRFNEYFNNNNFTFVEQDISLPLQINIDVNYIIHAASNADPISFATDPVGTMKSNFMGMYHLLEYAKTHHTQRVLYISSGEVYGQGDNNITSFSEDYCGYIDYINPRACYPSSKRAAETLCASYIKQYKLDAVIARPCHVYGATFARSDSRVIAQFLRAVVSGEDIIMKSEGSQIRSYCYVADVVSGLLYILFYGETGQAYNIADKNSIVSIKKLAEILAAVGNKKVRYEIPDLIEKSGYSGVTRAVLDSSKIESLGWNPKIGIEEGLKKTLNILINTRNN